MKKFNDLSSCEQRLLVKGLTLRDFNLRGADLSGANLSGADLSNADLTNTKFSDYIFQIVDFLKENQNEKRMV